MNLVRVSNWAAIAEEKDEYEDLVQFLQTKLPATINEASSCLATAQEYHWLTRTEEQVQWGRKIRVCQTAASEAKAKWRVLGQEIESIRRRL